MSTTPRSCIIVVLCLLIVQLARLASQHTAYNMQFLLLHFLRVDQEAAGSWHSRHVGLQKLLYAEGVCSRAMLPEQASWQQTPACNL